MRLELQAIFKTSSTSETFLYLKSIFNNHILANSWVSPHVQLSIGYQLPQNVN